MDPSRPFPNNLSGTDKTVTVGPAVGMRNGKRDGEGVPPGSTYTLRLVTPPNLSTSCTENAGPDGPSVNGTSLPEFDRSVRRTGRVK